MYFYGRIGCAKKSSKTSNEILFFCCCRNLIHFELKMHSGGKKVPPAPTVAFSRRVFYFLASRTWPPAANVSSFWSLFPPISFGRGGGAANGRVLSVVGKCQEASWISLMKEDHRVSRSLHTKSRVLLHFKGSAEKYQSSWTRPERCRSVHGRCGQT